MKPIKKFSTEMNQPKSILESLDSKALDELIKGMGFKDIHELKREKNLLAKLEALLKEVNPKHDISEDDAEDIEDEIKKKGEPKSLVDKMGDKEPSVPVGDKPEEVAEEETDGEETEEESDEDEATDAEATKSDDKADKAEVEVEVDDTAADSTEAEPHTEPDADDAGGPSDNDADNKEDEEEEEEVEEESKTTPKATRRIMTFEDFIQEETTTVNKNVSYRDDEDEEDNAVPVADSIEVEESSKMKSTGSGVKSFSKFVSEAYADKGPELKDQESSADSISLPIAAGDGSKTAAKIADDTVKMGKPEEKKEEEGEELVTKDQEITEDPKTSKDEADTQGKVVVKESLNEAEIKSDADFKEYAMTVLKKAFGDKFDETKAGETADGLISKYKGDYGAMVGALQSGLDK